MALTYQLIASNTLLSNASSITFSSIPNTYTDLVLRASIRSQNAEGYFYFDVSGITSGYSETDLRGNGSTASSVRGSADGQFFGQGYLRTAGSGTTANTFNSVEVYLPNYAGSNNKVASAFSVNENNAATIEFITVGAGLLSNTSAITSITCYTAFASGSSFFLYGIKNS